MKKFRILVDMDNVLENLGDVWVDELNKRHGFTMTHEDITEWDVAKFYPTLSRTQVFAPLHQESTWKRIEPLPGAQDAVARLQKDGHEVIVVTAAHPDTVKWKYDWLSKHFPKIAFRDIVFCTKKQLIRGDFLIDDAPHNLFGGVYTPIMFAAPHNRQWKPKTLAEFNVYCTEDWPDTERLIVYLAELAEMMDLEKK